MKLFAIAGRVLVQLSHDKRTLGLLFVVPPVLLTVLKYVFQSQPQLFNAIAPMLLGIFPMVMMFLVTSIATLRERTSGTLDRLMTTSMSKASFIFGYAIAFSLVASLQALVAAGVLLRLLDVSVLGGTGPTIAGAVLAAFLGTALGLFASAFAASEFQAVQFMPAFLFPQLLICGLFTAREHMARPLQWFADIMPLTYSVDAMKQVTTRAAWTTAYGRDLGIIAAFAVTALVLGAVTIRRQVKP
jgi:ABC-2 type transport system permease protein